MAGKQLVTSVSSTIRKNLQQNQAVTPEEIQVRKRELLCTIDKGLDLFRKNLEDGKVAMDSSLDLERLAKLFLVLSGNPDSISGQAATEETTITQEASITMSKVETILDDNDPEVRAMFERLYNGYNIENDKIE